MSILHRSVLLVVIAAAALLGLSAPAQAGFSATAAMATLTVGTVTVDATAKPSVSGSGCSTTTWYSNINGQVSQGTTTTLRASVSWDASSTPRVTSYVVSAQGAGSSTKVAEVPATSLSAAIDVTMTSADKNVFVTVTAKTASGWTAESPKAGPIKC